MAAPVHSCGLGTVLIFSTAFEVCHFKDYGMACAGSLCGSQSVELSQLQKTAVERIMRELIRGHAGSTLSSLSIQPAKCIIVKPRDVSHGASSEFPICETVATLVRRMLNVSGGGTSGVMRA